MSINTGKITNTTSIDINMRVGGGIKYKDGFLLYGSQYARMIIKYYNLKTGELKTKKLEEEREGTIISADTDEKGNLYIVGYNEDNFAYLSKYAVNNWNFQKIYDSVYKNDGLGNDTTTFNEIIVLKNNKFVVNGNTLILSQYFTDKHFIVFYDGSKTYKIDKVIKGSGNIDIVESEEEDNEVKYQVKPGFGYKLISLKIVTESGKEIEVSDDYTFTMPDENITITAVFEPIINNPVTGNNLISLILETAIFITFIYGTTKCIKKNRNQINSNDY